MLAVLSLADAREKIFFGGGSEKVRFDLLSGPARQQKHSNVDQWPERGL
jgi:hypothetical protein